MQVRHELERFTADVLYFDQHRREIHSQYPDRWVAVYKQQVVGAAKGIKQLVKQLERKGVPRQHVFIDYTTERDDVLIL